LLLCSKFKISNFGNISQRRQMFFHSGSTLLLKGTFAATWKFSCSLFKFLKDFDYFFPLEGLKQKLELFYHTMYESSRKVLVWELVTWTKVNDFFSRQSKDQWKILSLQIDKTNGPHPPKHNFQSTPLAKEPIKNTTCTKILNCTHYLSKVKNGSKGWASIWSSKYHLHF
jgi:hypothetical protein